MLSVVIPWFNKDTILRVLNGLCQQTVSSDKYEIIIVNDGGDHQFLMDLTLARRGILSGPNLYLLPFPDAEVRFQAGACRNFGASKARGERVLFLDADCIPDPETVERHLAYGATNCVLMGSLRWVHHCCQPTPEAYAISAKMDPRQSIYPEFAKEVKQQGNTFNTNFYEICWSGHMSVPTKEFQACGGFWERLKEYGSEDQELGWRMQQLGSQLRVDFDIVAWHVDHPRSLPGKDAVARRKQTMSQTKKEPLIRPSRFLPVKA